MPNIEQDAHYTPHLPTCPNNGLHGITICDRCNDITNMDKPTPAAPALSISPPPVQPILTTLPSRAGVWQRSYGAPATRSATPITTSTHHHEADDGSTYTNIVYQSLQRPKLLRGGEWQLSVANNLLAAGFGILTLMSWNWRYLIGAFFFGWPVQWMIRALGRRDPKFWQKYVRTWNQPLIREPHGSPDDSAPAPRILPAPGWFVH